MAGNKLLEAELKLMREENARLMQVPGSVAVLRQHGPGDFALVRQRHHDLSCSVHQSARRQLEAVARAAEEAADI